MSLWDVLLGRTRPVESKLEKMFAVATAQVTLQVNLGLNPTGKAAICFRPVTTSSFGDAEAELKAILDLGTKETGTEAQVAMDRYGFRWVLLKDEQFEDLVAAIHIVSETLQEHGFRDQLLAAVFQFLDEHQRQVYWIYNYKRGSFYPFVPMGDKNRDNAYELRLRAVMERELPLEPELERWFALWDIPLSPESGHHQ
ncbi:MAG: hypothetical protein M1358_22330 [Chloroflexi bacterium]|nr:hypothetical protein [Chloroflexota bacterium]